MKLESVHCLLCGEANPAPLAQGTDYDYGTVSDPMTFVACRSCNHWYLDPRPAPESAGIIYPSNYYTLDGSHQRGALRWMGRLKDAITLRRLGDILGAVPPEGRVVDLGCGDGSLLLAIRSIRPAAALFAIDLGFAPARRAQLEQAGIECIATPLESAELPPALDLVIMNQVIEHLWDVDACLGKIRQSLRPGGRLSVCTPDVDGYDARWFRSGAWGGYYFPRHLNLFNRDSLTKVLARNGLRVCTWRSLVAPLVWASTLRALQVRRRWPAWARPRDTNFPVLATFAFIDRVAMLLGLATSNQQAIAARD